VLPEGVYLTYLKQSGTRFEIRGIAQSSTRVSTFMRNIDSSEWLSDSQLQVLEQNRGGNVQGAQFTLFANQRSHATPEGEDQQQVASK
jgi:type IV pilus assembly protein PilN